MDTIFMGLRVEGGGVVEGHLIRIKDRSYIVVDAECVNSHGDGTDLYATEFYEVFTDTVQAVNTKPIKSLEDINLETEAGKMLLVALTMLSKCEGYTDKTPDQIIQLMEQSKPKMFDRY